MKNKGRCDITLRFYYYFFLTLVIISTLSINNSIKHEMPKVFNSKPQSSIWVEIPSCDYTYM